MTHGPRGTVPRLSRRPTLLVLALLAAVVAGLPAQEIARSDPPPTVDVFGTDRFSGEELLRAYRSELEAMAAYARGDTTRLTPEMRARVRDGIRARGDFAFIDLSVVAYPRSSELQVGITLDVVERADSARRMDFLAPPDGSVPDPGGLLHAWEAYEAAAFALLRGGNLDPEIRDCGAHHCLMGFAHDSLAPFGRRFDTEVPRRADALVRVLRSDADPRKRKSAAYLLAHLQDPQRVADLLIPSVPDPDSGVRNSVLRVLWQVAANPEVEMPLDPFLEALDYPGTTDRNKAAAALVHLSRRPEHREGILREAVPILLDMLALEQPNNHDPALAILRELSGRDLGERNVEAWREWWSEAVEDDAESLELSGASYVRLTGAREVALARSAAPAAVSSEATIWVLRGGRYEVAVEGANGNGCMVSRAWPTSLEPICYDAEGARTLLPIEIAFVESRIALGDREAARAAVEADIESGALPLPRRPSMAYMLSSGQRLVADGGRAVGAWRPHFMMYVPHLRAADIGIHGATSQVFVAREGEPLAHVITVAAEFIDPEESP